MSQQLENYIKQAKQTGKDDESIKQDLRGTGWSEADISEAFSASQAQTKSSVMITGDKITSKFLVTLIIVLIAIGIGIYFAFFIKVTPKQTANNSSVTSPIPTEPTVEQPENLIAETTKLLTIPEGYKYGGFPLSFNPLNKLVSYPDPIFSPDMRQVAYPVLIGDPHEKAFMVFKGKESEHYDIDKMGKAILSPDGESIAYPAAEENGKWFVVVNDHKGKTYSSILSGSLVLSPDSQHVAYIAISYPPDQSAKRVIVEDDNELGSYSTPPIELLPSLKLLFTPDSKRLVYITTDSKSVFVVFGDKMGEPYDHIWDPIISKDKRSVLYGARKNNILYSVSIDINSAKSTATKLATISNSDLKNISSIIFSPNQQRVAYILTNNGNKQSLVIDGKSSQTYYRIMNVFLPDYPSQNTVFTTLSPGTGGNIIGKIIIGNKEIETYYFPLYFGVNSNYEDVTYIAEDKDKKDYLISGAVNGGKPIPIPAVLGDKPVVFSNSGTLVAYVTLSHGIDILHDKYMVAIYPGNIKSQQPYDFVSNIVFSSDERRLIYGARDGADVWSIVQPTP